MNKGFTLPELVFLMLGVIIFVILTLAAIYIGMRVF
jgi:Tfp pilus assembly protein PilE